jgi:hypothetical protein
MEGRLLDSRGPLWETNARFSGTCIADTSNDVLLTHTLNARVIRVPSPVTIEHNKERAYVIVEDHHEPR